MKKQLLPVIAILFCILTSGNLLAIANDAGISTIPTSVCSGNQSFQLSMHNYGTNTITACPINWSVDGVQQTPYSWTGSLSPSATVDVAIGTTNFQFGKQYTIKAWTNLINDTNTANDTFSVTINPVSLNGTYTVGGSNPNFKNLKLAIDTLLKYGICGPITFNLRNGTYPDKLTLPAITGASLANSITIQSESGDSTKVILTDTSVVNTSAFITITGAKNLTIRKVTLRNVTSGHSNVLYISNTTNFLLSGCTLEGVRDKSTSDAQAVLKMKDGNSGVTIENSQFLYGSEGMYLGFVAGATIRNNKIRDPYTMGIILEQCTNSPVIEKNSVSSGSGNDQYCGIRIVLGSNERISKNQVTCATGSGITVYSKGTVTAKGLISNNYVEVSGAGSEKGIFIDGSSYQSVYNNSINMKSSGNQSAAMYVYYAKGINLRNNIFAADRGYAMYVDTISTTLDTCNYNDFYSRGTTLVLFNGVAKTNLAAYQSASGKEANSLVAAPNFAGSKKYYPSSVQLNNKGTKLNQVTDDLEGKLRDATTPDIGAVEFNVLADDAGVLAINPSTDICYGTNSITASIKNYGSNPVTQAIINWSVNGVLQTPYAWTGNLANGATSALVTIGSFTATTPDRNILAWTSVPNGKTDANTTNDTAQFGRNNAKLYGTYTIGGNVPDYASFEDAIKALTDNGICGPVVFNVRSFTYTEESLLLPAIQGSSAINTITFQSESGNNADVVLFSKTDANVCLTFVKTKYVRMKNMTFRKNPSGGVATVLVQETTNIEFTGNKFESTGNATHIAGNTQNNGLTITNNVFEKGFTAIGITNGPDVNNTNTDSLVRITGNIFNNQISNTVSIHNSFAPVFSNNTINCEKGFSEGLIFSSCLGGWKIEKNKMSGAFISINECTTNANSPALIANNFVSILKDPSYEISCIRSFNSSYVHIFNNNVLLNLSTTNSAQKNAAMSINFSQHLKIVNNNLVNNGGKYIYYIYPDTGSLSPVFDTVDYNNLRTTAAQISNLNSAYVDLNSWKASGLDQHAIAVDPYYASTKDLHITGLGVEGKGKPLARVTDDIDGDVRSSTPDIGADEYTLQPIDAGVFAFVQGEQLCPGTSNIQVQLKNYGSTNLTNVTINWEINGAVQTPVFWSGSLVAGQSTPVTLASYNFLNSTYALKAWTIKPNGVTDPFPKNDTAAIPLVQTSLKGVYTVGGSSPNFATLTEAVAALKENGVCGAVVLNIRKGTYNERIAISKIKGASAANTITFQSESGLNLDVMIQANTDDNGYVLKFDGCDFVSVKNVCLKTLSTSANTGHVAGFFNKTANTRIEQCILYGNVNAGSSFGLSVINGDNGNDKNSIVNNTILNGGYGIYWNSDGNNTGSGLLIQGNTVKEATTGIYIFNSKNVRVWSNEITNTSATTSKGMNIFFCNGFDVSKNTIRITKGAGIEVSSCVGTDSTKLFLKNNSITVNDATLGLRVFRSAFLEIHYNSIQVAKGDALQIDQSCAGCKAANLSNNIFSNTGGGYAINVKDKSALGTSDYNCFYTTGTYLGFYANAITNLPNWKFATKTDAKSISAVPGFVSASDLHITAASPVNNIGNPSVYVKDDIDGDLRNAVNTDIGADEYVSRTGDAGIVKIEKPDTLICYGVKEVAVALKNFDADTLTSVTISWTVNGVAQKDYFWTGKLVPGSSANSLILGTYAFNNTSPYTVKAWTTKPNAVNDKNTGNDTSAVIKSVSGLATVDLGNDTSYVCGGESIILKAGASYASYTWSNAQSFLSNASAYTTNVRGKYYLAVTNQSGCAAKDSIFIIMKDDSFFRIDLNSIFANNSIRKSAAWMDYNQDDNEDIAAFGAGATFATNKGKGNFEGRIVPASSGEKGASWADGDNDGDLDIAYVLGNYLYVTKQTGVDFYPDLQTSQVGETANWVDYDNDGKLDMALTKSNGLALLKDHGINGEFYFYEDKVYPENGYTQGWSDYDNDGDLDWYCVGFNSCHLYANDGKGNMTDVTMQAFGEIINSSYLRGCSWGDYNNDGNTDLLVALYPNNILYKNNGNGTFSRVTNAGPLITDTKNPSGSAWGDYDNDGDLDIFVNNLNNDHATQRSNSFYRNNGDGTFTENTGPEWNDVFYDSWVNYACAWGDMDNDGDIDLVSSSDNVVSLFVNNGNCRNWLQLKLTGTISNRSAIGAKVYLYATINGKAQILSREVSAQTGYNGQNSLRLHFGLGNATVVDSIKIAWPSGIKKILTTVAPNQYLKITEECDNTVCENVWPGDANSDLSANNKDLLSVGLYYGETGPARDSISSAWGAQKAKTWGKLQYNSHDLKHADCNGDGVVNDKDTVAIVLNYGLQHKRSFAPQEYNAVNPDLYLVPSKPIANPGDWIDLAIWTGTANVPVTDLYGLAFNIGHHTDIIQSGSLSMSYPDSWLAPASAEAIHVSKIMELQGFFDGGITRIDHTNKSGYGKIAVLRFRIRPTIDNSQVLNLDIVDFTGVDAAGNNKFFNAMTTSISIVPIVTGIDTDTAIPDLEVYPNPFLGETKISYTLISDKTISLEIYNVLGQKIETIATGKQVAGKYTYLFKKPAGLRENVFIVKFAINNQLFTKRIVAIE